jgi:hypothetical protein
MLSCAVVVLEVAQARVEARRVDVVVHVQALQVLLDRRVPYLVDHLDRLAVVQLRVGNRAEQQRHRPGGGDLRQRDDGQEQLLPFQPALLNLTEHVAADRAVLRAVHPVVLLLLHREVGPENLLERVLLLGLLERVVRPVVADRRVILRFPGELLDLLVGLGHALAAHRHPSLGGNVPPGLEGPVPWITQRIVSACVLSLRRLPPEGRPPVPPMSGVSGGARLRKLLSGGPARRLHD